MMFEIVLHFLLVSLLVTSGCCLEAIPVGKLPLPLYDTAALYDGDNSIYILGGTGSLGSRGNVLKYDLSTNQIEDVARFPIPVVLGSAQIDRDGNIYYFGTSTVDIYPIVWKMSTETLIPNIVHLLPTSVGACSSAYDGVDGFYVIGGVVAPAQPTRNILKFNSTTNDSEIFAELPEALFQTASAWSQGSVYIFGGDAGGIGADPRMDILRLTPSVNNQVVTLDSTLSVEFAKAATVTVQENIYVIGGTDGNQKGIRAYHEMSKFNPITQDLETLLVENFPEKLHRMSAAYVPKLDTIFVFGGLNSTFEISDDILSIELENK